MSARIVRIATALPSCAFTQDRAKALLERWYKEPSAKDADVSLATAKRVYDNSGVTLRYSPLPIEVLLEDAPLRRKNQLYIESARALSEVAVEKIFDGSDLKPGDVDLIITTSCTGFMIPALDAWLINRFGFRPDIRRLPITELGCAAGLSAIRMARDHIQAYPEATVLIVAVELPTLTFQPSDFTGAHIISTAIFGDGSAALLMTGRDLPGRAVQQTGTHFFPDTLDFMGYDLRETGFHIFLSPKIPHFIASDLMPLIKKIVLGTPYADQKIRWLAHPGGAKILDAIENALELPRGGLIESRGVLGRVGNLSSATIFFVLEEFLKKDDDSEFAGLIAVGPGFSMEYAFLGKKEN